MFCILTLIIFFSISITYSVGINCVTFNINLVYFVSCKIKNENWECVKKGITQPKTRLFAVWVVFILPIFCMLLLVMFVIYLFFSLLFCFVFGFLGMVGGYLLSVFQSYSCLIHIIYTMYIYGHNFVLFNAAFNSIAFTRKFRPYKWFKFSWFCVVNG